MLEKYNIKEYGFYVAVVTFFAFQVILADYGYRVDQFDYIESFDVSSDNLGGALKRDAITGIDAIYSENLNKWMMRFKLYSVDSDEVTNIMALARIRPSELEFDPHFYAYGGGYLYPLGGWFFFLEQLGWIEIGSLESMLNSPDRMDRVYYAGRIFVLISFALSALVLFYVLRSIQSNSFALLGVLIYMIIPVLVMFSITMKPHVYGMFWSNLALWVLVNAGNRGELTKKHVLGVGIVLGVAVGSASTYSLFAVLIWSGLAYYVWRGLVQPYALIMVPFIAVCAYVLTNPYVFINYDAYLQEVEKVQSWFY